MMKRLLILALLLLFGLAACNINTPDITPTAEILISDTPTSEIASTPTPGITPSLTATREIADVPVIVASPLPTQSDFVPTSDAPPSPTSGPCIETVQVGDSLIGILSRTPCGNEVTFGLVDAVVELNENIANADVLPAIGSTILIPLPTSTPIPEGANMTETQAALDGVEIIDGSRFTAGQEFGCYTVQEGDTVVGIADLYNTDLEVLSQRNPNLNWQGCDFTNPSGGPLCNPGIRIDACINVPLPTSTPVPSNTPSGRETATATPTQESARLISPPEGVIISQRVTLEWLSVGILQPDERYLIYVEDRTTGTSYSYSTPNTRLTLPDSLIPADGQNHAIVWRVTVGRKNDDETYTPVGGEGVWHSFQWQSR
jgi:hypothetical protein